MAINIKEFTTVSNTIYPQVGERAKLNLIKENIEREESKIQNEKEAPPQSFFQKYVRSILNSIFILIWAFSGYI